MPLHHIYMFIIKANRKMAFWGLENTTLKDHVINKTYLFKYHIE